MKYIPFVLILLLSSCHNRQQQANNLISQAETVLSENLDSALMLLQSIHEPETLTDSLKAKYWLAIGQIHTNSGRSMAEDSMLADALHYYEKSKNSSRTAQAYKLYAKHLWWKGDKTEAIELLNKGLENTHETNDTIGAIHLLKSLVYLNERSRNFEEAARCTKKLLAMDKSCPDPYLYYNGLGLHYYYLQQKDSALFYLQKACHTVKQYAGSMEMWCQLTRNYADILSDFGDDKAAIHVQQQVLRHYLQSKDKYTSLSYNSIFRYYLNLHQTDSAKYYRQLAEKTRTPHLDNDLSLGVYYTSQNTVMHYIATNRFTIKEITLFSNGMFDDYQDMEKVIAGKNETKRLLEQRNLHLSIAKQRNQLLLTIVLLAAALSAVPVIFYVQKRKKQLEEKEEELDTLKQLWMDVQKEQTENDRFFKKILLQQMGIIRMIATNPTPHNQEFLTQMTRITQEDMVTNDLLVWEDLYKVIDSIYDNFYTHTQLRFGNRLNERELQLCCLLKANFSTKEISVVTQQSVRTVYQRKTTIRQKLNMDEKEDIAEFLG